MLIRITALIAFNSFSHCGNFFIKTLSIVSDLFDKLQLYVVLYPGIITARQPTLGVGVIERFCVHEKDNVSEIGIVFLYIVFKNDIFIRTVGIQIKILQHIIKHSILECTRAGFIHN